MIGGQVAIFSTLRAAFGLFARNDLTLLTHTPRYHRQSFGTGIPPKSLESRTVFNKIFHIDYIRD